MRQSIADGTTLEIVYEGRTHNAEVTDKPGMDQRFADVFSDYNLSERLQILGFGSRDAYLEAQATIRAKAADMVDHYVRFVFPNSFKAQVVAVSREAAARYKAALDDALATKVGELEKRNPLGINVDRLRGLETAVVISGSYNDPPHLKAYTDPGYHRRSIQRFKLPFDRVEGQGETQTLVGGKSFAAVLERRRGTGASLWDRKRLAARKRLSIGRGPTITGFLRLVRTTSPSSTASRCPCGLPPSPTWTLSPPISSSPTPTSSSPPPSTIARPASRPNWTPSAASTSTSSSTVRLRSPGSRSTPSPPQTGSSFPSHLATSN